MIELFNSINNAFCGVLGINSYLQGVIVMTCINVIAVLGMSVLTGFTRLFSFGNAGFMCGKAKNNLKTPPKVPNDP